MMTRYAKMLGILVCALSFSGCASFRDAAKEAAKEALAEVAPVLKEAGKDLIAEARAQASMLASDLGQKAMKVWVESKGDLKATIQAVIADIPGLAKDAGEKAATDAIAKRIAASEGQAKADEFKARAGTDGLPAALQWASGGGVLGLAGYVWRLLKQKAALAGAISSAPPEARAALLANAPAHAIVEKAAGPGV